MVYAVMSFSGDDFDPIHASKALRLIPSRQIRKGEPRLRRTSDGRGVSDYGTDYCSGRWMLSSENVIVSKKTETHLRWLYDQMKDRETELIAFFKNCRPTAVISVYPKSQDNLPSKALREKVKALGFRIEFTFPDMSYIIEENVE